MITQHLNQKVNKKYPLHKIEQIASLVEQAIENKTHFYSDLRQRIQNMGVEEGDTYAMLHTIFISDMKDILDKLEPWHDGGEEDTDLDIELFNWSILWNHTS